ncbi:E3 ubiquitin-protein ligase Topors-like isoform X2 [Zootermopsis nevadensis]|uniref:E3 ubiquitin-protein ligase Topors-like isoform X2 n=1 Tax=Zootermopsis nevadensis TaxID=136037 RepID=UPI000B8EDD02|nr:E3 ubiquitin-protein ligase Topors-like isoform X2 [Zootermopsis nevadensis]
MELGRCPSPDAGAECSPTVEREKSPSPSIERGASPEPNCAICLGKSRNKCFTDSCLHQFCFNCLLEWSKVKPECPLCKQSFKSIIHNVRSNEDYDQYHLHPAAENPYPWVNMINIDMVQQPFRYRTTFTPNRRLERVLEHLDQRDLRHRMEPGDVLPAQRTFRRRRGLVPNEFRMNVYNQNLWLTTLPSVGLPRDLSPQNFRNHPEEVHRLIPWLNRELQVILRSPGLSARVLNLVISQLPHNHMLSEEFRLPLSTFLRHHCDHFIHEFTSFAGSSYDMVGFDENAHYTVPNNFGDMVHEVLSDSSDSDVVILPSHESHSPSRSHRRRTSTAPQGSNRRRTSPAHQGSRSPVAGPSRNVLPVDQASDSDINNLSSSHSDTSLPSILQHLPTSSGHEEDQPSQLNEDCNSDDCVIVGCVKPRHERTPEVITLLSSDPEADEGEVMELAQMTCTGSSDRSYSHAFSTSASCPESSGSEYNPVFVRKSQKKKKKAQHKRKSGNTAKSKGHKARKTTASAKKHVLSNQDHSNIDSDSLVYSCNGKNSNRQQSALSSSTCTASSSDSCSSSISSNPTYISRSLHSSHKRRRSRHSSHRNKKESWKIQVNKPDTKQEYDYSGKNYDTPSTSSEVNSSINSFDRRPKLRSIVISRAANGDGKYPESSGGSSHDRRQKSLTKKSQSQRWNIVLKKVKDDSSAEPSTSGSSHHHKDRSYVSQSAHRYDGSGRYSSKSGRNARQKHNKKDEKDNKQKKRIDSDSSVGREEHVLKPKKRKRILSLFTDSSDD